MQYPRIKSQRRGEHTELAQLQEAEKRGQRLPSTKRSRLPDAVNTVLREHVVTAANLAKSLDVTPQAAWNLLRQLEAAGIVREATGRGSWRAYITDWHRSLIEFQKYRIPAFCFGLL
jgi:ribosomal protein S25